MSKTQAERILEFIQKYGSITQKQAVNEFGCYRLSARIFDLEETGFRFDRAKVTQLNRFGEKVSFTKYSLAKE